MFKHNGFFQTSTSWKTLIDNWHIQTQNWFRNLAFDRLPKSGKMIGVFSLSALWHGFYPGYYLASALAAIAVYVGKAVIFYCVFGYIRKAA